MEKELGIFTIRRLFIEDMPVVKKYAGAYSRLFTSPLKEDNISNIFLQGAFWAVFDGEKAVAATYILPADSPCFVNTGARWNISELLGIPPDDCLICGYLWTEKDCAEVNFYNPLCRLWQTQADRRKKAVLVHFTPAHMDTEFEKLFYNGFELAGLRGLDNLVPHYIFTKPAGFYSRKTQACEDVKACPRTDTKTLSRLCEKGYRGFDMDVEKNILLRR